MTVAAKCIATLEHKFSRIVGAKPVEQWRRSLYK